MLYTGCPDNCADCEHVGDGKTSCVECDDTYTIVDGECVSKYMSTYSQSNHNLGDYFTTSSIVTVKEMRGLVTMQHPLQHVGIRSFTFGYLFHLILLGGHGPVNRSL